MLKQRRVDAPEAGTLDAVAAGHGQGRQGRQGRPARWASYEAAFPFGRRASAEARQGVWLVILGSYNMLRLRLTHNWADVGKCTCGSARGGAAAAAALPGVAPPATLAAEMPVTVHDTRHYHSVSFIMMVPVRLLSGARHPQAASVQRPKGARSRAGFVPRPSLSCPGVGAGRAGNWQCGLLGCAAAEPPGQLTSAAGAARRLGRGCHCSVSGVRAGRRRCRSRHGMLPPLA
jgi:hypothetical protein